MTEAMRDSATMPLWSQGSGAAGSYNVGMTMAVVLAAGAGSHLHVSACQRCCQN